MNNKVVKFLMFTAGAVIGSVVTWKVVKTKYEEIAQEEINSVKEEYARLMVLMKKKLNESVVRDDGDDSDNDDDDANDDNFNETDMTNYHEIANGYRSSNDEEETQNEKEGDEKEEDNDETPYINGPYVISDEEFGDRTDFSAQPLDYFADGILADGWGVELDIDETIGEDALNHFGEYADDIVYVRNERTEIDYEVTKDPRTYAEAVKTNPYSYYNQ